MPAATKPKITRPAVVEDAKNVVLGEKYTDSVSGIRGTAIIVYVHLTGCDQVCLAYSEKDKKKLDYVTVDATRLVELQQVEAPRRGGPGSPMPSSKVPE